MKTEDFDYQLPKDLIALYPEKKRDESRLLHLQRSNNEISHHRFYDIVNFLKPGDLLVLNDTKVVPAKLYGETKLGKKVELLLIGKESGFRWRILMKGPKVGTEIIFSDEFCGKIVKSNSDDWLIEFDKDIEEFIEDHGLMPLPPYIDRLPEAKDRTTYQTIYAKNEGAVAAPTAGLHFTKELLLKLEDLGVEIEYITLHVGIGTFRPVKAENIGDHKMHTEFCEISPKAALRINSAKEKSRRVIAVGTTVVRVIESAASNKNKIEAGKFHTDLFIYPPYNFKIVDAMITNFHLPRSTLLMLVSAFTGKELLFDAYSEAIERNYRLLSYGDAMFIV